LLRLTLQCCLSPCTPRHLLISIPGDAFECALLLRGSRQMPTHYNNFLGLFLFFFFAFLRPGFAVTPDTTDIPDAGKPVAGSLVSPAEGMGVRVLSHHGQWSSFFSMSGESEEIFLITGRLENTSGKPFTAVKLQCELLGDDNVAVLRDYGYNRKAEALRD